VRGQTASRRSQDARTLQSPDRQSARSQCGGAPPLHPDRFRCLRHYGEGFGLFRREFQELRQQGFIPGSQIRWPDIKPMWFHYPNPVSGRLPPHYCPDEHTCEAELAARAMGR